MAVVQMIMRRATTSHQATLASRGTCMGRERLAQDGLVSSVTTLDCVMTFEDMPHSRVSISC